MKYDKKQNYVNWTERLKEHLHLVLYLPPGRGEMPAFTPSRRRY